ncbi:DUF4135 domain-containing protein [Endozoicomonas arenosclerae]|uniref:DUF4135 domain-containing protein n=1 Tax=Endozoicomonas arenosclerae TaxID=1633495 RepID=UPI000780CB9E|nr:DUF4135 domain-containing protein [Endozoicomonas arenosclerae]
MTDQSLNHTLFGCLVSWGGNVPGGYNGLREANEAFIKAVIRYSRFDELHLYLHDSQTEAFRLGWKPYLDQYGAGKSISILPVNQLSSALQQHAYTVFHSGDPYISDLASLRDRHATRVFPITGRAHSLSDDARLSRVRDLIFSPLKPCDSIICSSSAQKTVMKRLLASASATFSDTVGVAVPYRGQVSLIPLGIEPAGKDAVGKAAGKPSDSVTSDDASNENSPVILCLGRLSETDKMDLHPLLLALNDLLEEGVVTRFQLVVAGVGDASGEYLQSLLAQAYEFNLEDFVRFELTVDEEKKQQLLAQADVFVSLADNIQESFGLAPLEAMREGVPVILSDWNGYRDLITSGQGGYLIPTASADHDALSRSLSLVNKTQAQFIQAQGVSLDFDALKQALASLLLDQDFREEMSLMAVQRVNEKFSWPLLIDQYHELVDELGREASRIRHHQGREVGMPYRDVFGHYASSALEESAYLVATDRGLRVLLMSEKGFLFSQLKHLLDKKEIRGLIRKLVTPGSVEKLLAASADKQRLLFSLSWMLKYQLIEFSGEVDSQEMHSVRLPEWYANEIASIVEGLSFPEQRRSCWIKPFINRFLTLCFVGEDVADTNDNLMRSIAQEIVKWMDERLLQAIGWFAQEQGLTSYGEVLKLLENNGVQTLLETYPNWYRNGQREFIQQLRLIRMVLARVKDDIAQINDRFFADASKSVTDLAGIRNLKDDLGSPVYELIFDNGERLVYKLRDLTVDELLVGDKGSLAQSLNGWVNDPDALGVFKILNKSSYGYVEFIAREAVTDVRNLESYYRRLGVAGSFCLMAGLADIHSQNIHTSGDRPYLVDVETALHSSVIMQLEAELQNPELGFMRGMQESSLGYTGLNKLWENFHSCQTQYSSVKLENGELVTAESQQISPFIEHLLISQGRHSLDGRQPPVEAKYSSAFAEGFNSALTAVTENTSQWCDAIKSLKGCEVRYQPRCNLNDLRKQFRDFYVAREFQKISRDRCKGYFLRVAKRITLAGEVSQRWLESMWQEPISMLAKPVAERWMAMEQSGFVRKVGEPSVFVQRYDGSIHEISDHYFSVDLIERQVAVITKLSDESLRKRFLDAYLQMINSWFEEHLKPGEGMPEQVRQGILEDLGKKGS